MNPRQGSIAFACALLVGATRAQEPAADAASATQSNDDVTVLEKITITAQRRPEVLSKAPIAASILSQNALDSQGISAVADIGSSVPNLQLVQNGFSMRGIGNNNPFGGYSTVAVQVDGIYEPAYQALSLGLFDIDRIEAVRGPQGTVYGRNATAGVVNIETARATSKFLAFGDLAYGSYRDITARGVINVPVSDAFQVRASVMKRKSDGYDDGGASPRNYGEIGVASARLAWTLQATRDLRWRASLSAAQNDGTVLDSVRASYTYFPDANIATGTLGAPVTVAPGGNILGYRSATDLAKDLRQTAFRSNLTWSINDRWSVTYLAGATRLVNNGVDFATGVFTLTNADNTTRTQSHEIDVNYESDALKLVGGLYTYRDRTSGAQKVSIGDALPFPLSSVLPPPIIVSPGVGFEPTSFGIIDVARRANEDANDSNAVFGQAVYSISPALRVTGGTRYTRDKFATHGDLQVCAFGTVAQANMALSCAVPFGPPTSLVASSSSSNTSWRLGVDYDLSRDHLVFASVSTGYRGGGATPNVAPEFSTYKPETLTSIELGWRGRMLDETLGLNVTAFDMDYKNLQVSGIGQDISGTNTPVTTNSPTARIRGLELEGDWLATRHDRLQGFFTYLDARFGTFIDPVGNPDNISGVYNNFAPVPIPATPGDYTGNRLPNAPRVSLRARYTRAMTLDSGSRLTPSIQVYWQSGTYTSLANISDPARGYRKAYSKTDLNVRWESADRRWAVDGYMYNAENRKVYATAVPGAAYTVVSYLPPRTVGVRVGLRFE
jgi:iron complex outermembrane receptor protein